MKTTKTEFTWRHGCHMETVIPAGAPVLEDAEGNLWVASYHFPPNSIERHDATYYGCRVKPDNVVETDATAQ